MCRMIPALFDQDNGGLLMVLCNALSWFLPSLTASVKFELGLEISMEQLLKMFLAAEMMLAGSGVSHFQIQGSCQFC